MKKNRERSKNARVATDRFKKCDNVESMIRKKLPSANSSNAISSKAISSKAVLDHSLAARMPEFEWRWYAWQKRFYGATVSSARMQDDAERRLRVLPSRSSPARGSAGFAAKSAKTAV
jgi:hypothetical protein